MAGEKQQVRTLMLKTRMGLGAQAGTIRGKEGAKVRSGGGDEIRGRDVAEKL